MKKIPVSGSNPQFTAEATIEGDQKWHRAALLAPAGMIRADIFVNGTAKLRITRCARAEMDHTVLISDLALADKALVPFASISGPGSLAEPQGGSTISLSLEPKHLGDEIAFEFCANKPVGVRIHGSIF